MKPEYAVQIIWSREDNAYLAISLELQGCVADGSTPEEALRNVRVQIAEWIEVANEEGRPVPPPLAIEDNERINAEFQSNLQRHIQIQVQFAVQQVLAQLAAQQPQGVVQAQGQVHTEYFRGIALEHTLKPVH